MRRHQLMIMNVTFAHFHSVYFIIFCKNITRLANDTFLLYTIYLYQTTRQQYLTNVPERLKGVGQ